MIHRRLTLFLAAAILLVAGCASTTGSGGHDGHETGAATPAATGTPAAGPHNDADVMFAQMMIPHHQQAIVMSDLMLGKSGVPADVTGLATQIKAAQGPEITRMTGWLAGWGEGPEGGTHMGHGGDDGMLTEAELDQLREATGAAAVKLFLDGMIAHHEGAVTMAKTEQRDGENTEAKALATEIVTTQQAEITTMRRLLAAG